MGAIAIKFIISKIEGVWSETQVQSWYNETMPKLLPTCNKKAKNCSEPGTAMDTSNNGAGDHASSEEKGKKKKKPKGRCPVCRDDFGSMNEVVSHWTGSHPDSVPNSRIMNQCFKKSSYNDDYKHCTLCKFRYKWGETAKMKLHLVWKHTREIVELGYNAPRPEKKPKTDYTTVLSDYCKKENITQTFYQFDETPDLVTCKITIPSLNFVSKGKAKYKFESQKKLAKEFATNSSARLMSYFISSIQRYKDTLSEGQSFDESEFLRKNSKTLVRCPNADCGNIINIVKALKEYTCSKCLQITSKPVHANEEVPMEVTDEITGDVSENITIDEEVETEEVDTEVVDAENEEVENEDAENEDDENEDAENEEAEDYEEVETEEVENEEVIPEGGSSDEEVTVEQDIPMAKTRATRMSKRNQ